MCLLYNNRSYDAYRKRTSHILKRPTYTNYQVDGVEDEQLVPGLEQCDSEDEDWSSEDEPWSSDERKQRLANDERCVLTCVG